MKFQTSKAPTVVTDQLPGERREFSIATNGKAFRVLIDGLYENKIGSVVREIISNGYDAHAAAGAASKAIKVTAPTHLDPTFRVRDFGVSMTHDTVMEVYSTIFQSTKEDNNDEVGMFGLGSKSPFAYTNTFSVICYLNGEKRVYVAHIADDDVPQITHLVTEPSDDPQGVEVSIAVQPHDVRRFATEITKMFHAAEVPFELDGLSVTPQPVVFEGSNFVVLEGQECGAAVGVRQGPVVYPYRNRSVSNVESYGYSVIITVPIGTVEVTASRESMSLTDQTTNAIDNLIAQAEKEIDRHIEEVNAQFENRLAEYQGHERYEWCRTPIGRSRIRLVPDQTNKRVYSGAIPGVSIERQQSKAKTIRMTDLTPVDGDRYIVIRPGEKVVRMKKRIAEYWDTHFRWSSGRRSASMFVISSEALPRLVRILGITPEQVIPVSTLPDYPPPPRQSNRSGGGSIKREIPVVGKGQWWVPKTGQKTVNFKFAPGLFAEYVEDFWATRDRSRSYYSDWTSDNGSFLTYLGFKPEDIVFLTEKQAEKAGVANKRRFEDELAKRIERKSKKLDLQAMADAVATRAAISRSLSPWDLDQKIRQAGVTDRPIRDFIAPLVTQEVESAVPNLADNPDVNEEKLIQIAEIEGKNLLTGREISTTVDRVAKVFNGVSVDALIQNHYHNNK